MAYNFGDAVGFPEAESDTPPADEGRLGGLFCRLQRREFTGVVHVETDATYSVFSFRNGTIVFVEESAPGAKVADQLLDSGLVTRDQYADVVSRMTDSLVDNEDVTFCAHAVELGYVREDDVRTVMQQRVRAKLISAMSLRDCRVEIDDSPDALTLEAEYPQSVGPLVYLGVCTFYDEALLEALVPDPAMHYARLSRPHGTVAQFFELEGDEAKFLKRLDGETKLARVIASAEIDRSQALQLLTLVHISGLAEFTTAPYAPAPEPSGVRSTQLRRPATPMPFAAAKPGFVAAREVTGPASRGAASPTARATREGRDTRDTREHRSAREERSAHEPRQAREERQPAPAHRPAEKSAPAAQPAAAPRRSPVTAPSTSASRSDTTEDSTAMALAEAKARAAKRAAQGAGAAQRLGRQLSQLRGATVPIDATPAAPSRNPGEGAGYAKAHLKEILARRKQVSQESGPQKAPAAEAPRNPVADFKQAITLIRQEQYGKAEELLRGVIELEPQNAIAATYHQWAKLRSSAEPERQASDEMREAARKLVSNDDHGAFACFMLGHLAFVDKKDEVAEKFFRKAFTRDKTLKSAERHIKILERRQAILAQEQAKANTKIFGITIGSTKKD